MCAAGRDAHSPKLGGHELGKLAFTPPPCMPGDTHNNGLVLRMVLHRGPRRQFAMALAGLKIRPSDTFLAISPLIMAEGPNRLYYTTIPIHRLCVISKVIVGRNLLIWPLWIMVRFSKFKNCMQA